MEVGGELIIWEQTNSGNTRGTGTGKSEKVLHDLENPYQKTLKSLGVDGRLKEDARKGREPSRGDKSNFGGSDAY